MVLVSLDEDPGPTSAEEALKDISKTWSNFMDGTGSKDGAKGSPDGQPTKKETAAPPAKATEKQASAKRAASPKKRSTSVSKTKKKQDSKPEDKMEIEVNEDMMRAALETAEVRAALDGLATAFQSGDPAASSAAVEKLMAGATNRRSERFPTPPGFAEAWSKMQKSPKCPGSLSNGTNFFGPNGFTPGDRTASPNFPDDMQRRMVASDWKMIQAKSKMVGATGSGKSASEKNSAKVSEKAGSSKASAGGMSSFFSKFTGKKETGGKTKAESAESADEAASSSSMMSVAMDFDSLAKMNAGIIGTDMSWFSLVLKNFDQLLAGVANGSAATLESYCDVLSLQLSKQARGKVNLNEFQTCLLSSTRALLPEVWDAQHEAAWIACWKCIADQLQQVMHLPAKYEKAVVKLIAGLSTEQVKQIGSQSFVRLFKDHPQSENYFKQSNARLAFIVQKALEMSVQIFQDPVRMVDEITALGLRHIMFKASTKFFQPFVTSVMSEVQLVCKDELGIDGLNWAMCVIGSIMVRTLQQGATPILKAVVRNDAKGLKKAMSLVPRGERAKAVLGEGPPTGRGSR